MLWNGSAQARPAGTRRRRLHRRQAEFLVGLALVFLAPVSPAFGEPPGLQELLTPSEFREYQRKNKYKDRMNLFREVFERVSRQITSQVKQGLTEQSMETLDEIQALCRAARQESERPTDPKDYRSKQIKKLEIRLRKLVETLDDLKNTFAYEDRDRFEQTADALERFRDQLLARIFSKPRSLGAAALTGTVNPTLQALSGFRATGFGAVATRAQRRRGSGITGDQFTDAEYEKIQDAQRIRDRVKAFLTIAESRLDELDRRREDREWEEEEPNPLEFFTPGQLLHAYNRALEGTMINIDEKAKYKTATEKDIRKSLEQVNEKASAFSTRLESVRQYAVDRKDEELFLEWREAKKQTEIALKGSQLGLGAPVR